MDVKIKLEKLSSVPDFLYSFAPFLALNAGLMHVYPRLDYYPTPLHTPTILLSAGGHLED
jgi:hypothetical protein